MACAAHYQTHQGVHTASSGNDSASRRHTKSKSGEGSTGAASNTKRTSKLIDYTKQRKHLMVKSTSTNTILSQRSSTSSIDEETKRDHSMSFTAPLEIAIESQILGPAQEPHQAPVIETVEFMMKVRPVTKKTEWQRQDSREKLLSTLSKRKRSCSAQSPKRDEACTKQKRSNSSILLSILSHAD